MPKVRATVTMYTDLEWIGEIPDDIPERDHYEWVKENIDGSEYSEVSNSGDWNLEWVEVIDDGEV